MATSLISCTFLSLQLLAASEPPCDRTEKFMLSDRHILVGSRIRLPLMLWLNMQWLLDSLLMCLSGGLGSQETTSNPSVVETIGLLYLFQLVEDVALKLL